MSKEIDVSKLHVSDLYTMVLSGNKDALEELVDRQQEGRALRFYPSGRAGAEDDGLVVVWMESKDGAVEIRSGRPARKISIKKDTVLEWMKGIPKLLASAVNWHIKSGKPEAYIQDYLEGASDDQFDVNTWVSEERDEIEIQFSPEESDRWRLDGYDCALLVKDLMLASEAIGWNYEEEISNKEITAIQKMLEQFPVDD